MSKRKINYHPLPILRNKSDRAILMVCIGIAFVFWLGAKMGETYDTSLRIALAFEPPSPRTTLVQSPPEALDVTLKGTGWQLAAQAFKRRPLALRYALAADTQQVFRLQQLTRDVSAVLPSDIQITTITPELIALNLDAKATKVVPITLPHYLSTADQFVQVGPPELLPDSVVITGPASVLRGIASWHTDTLRYSGLRQSLKGEIALSPFPSGQVMASAQRLHFQVPVEQLTEKKLLIPIQVDAPDPSRWHIFPDQVAVTCNLPLSEYERLQKADIQVLVRPSRRPYAPVRVVRLPATVEAYRLSVDSVRVFWYEDGVR